MIIYIIGYAVWFVVTAALLWDMHRSHVQSKARAARIAAMADRLLRMRPEC
jgi:hypothetical protein